MAQVDGAAVIAGLEEPGGLEAVAGYGECVDVGGIEGQPVPAVTPDDDVGLLERAPQARDLRVQGVHPGVHGLGGPQVLDEPVAAHSRTGLDGQADEQLGRLASRYGQEPAVPGHLDRSEHRHA